MTNVASAVDLLVVDDDPEFRETLRARFSRQGFEVALASSGDEALASST
jgi:DNA-binding response OmpR family regulator